MKLLFLSLYYAPEFTSNSPIVTAIASEMQRRGHEVVVLAGTPHYRLDHIPSKYRWSLWLQERIDGVKVIRCRTYADTRGILPKLLNYLTYLLTSVWPSLLVSKSDVVVAISPPFLLGLTGLLVKKVRGSNFVYNAQDLFPESYAASGKVSSSLVLHSMDKVQRWIYRKSDAIAVITPGFLDNLRAKGIDPQKITVIPNFTDFSKISILPRNNSFSEGHGLTGKITVLYAGNIGFTHGVEIVADVAEALSGRENILFVVVGDGSGLPALKNEVASRGIRNIKFLDTQPVEKLSAMLSSADIGLITTKRGVGHTSFPSRVFNLMAAKRSVIASVDTDSDIAKLLEETGCGIVVPAEDREKLAAAILRLGADPELRAAMGEKGQRALQRSFTLQRVADRYEQLFKTLQAQSRQ